MPRRDTPVIPISVQRLTTHDFETWMSSVNKHIRNTLDVRTRTHRGTRQEAPARLEILPSQAANDPSRHRRSYVRWPTPPTIHQAGTCWDLSPTQLQAFLPLAYIIRMENREIPQAQLLLVVQGRPGTGKSRVIEAVLWYAFQLNASHLVGVTSYTWRAVLQLNAPYHDPESTSTMLGITVGDKLQENTVTRRRAQDNLHGVRLLIIDELSFLSLRHIDAMSTAVRVSVTALDPTRYPTVAFAGLHTAMFGDLDQHQPVAHGADPLFYGASNPQVIRTPADQRGHHIWRHFNYVVTLAEQHRMDPSDPSACQLYHTALLFATPAGVSRQRIEQCCDDLNGKAINDINTYVPENPHVATLRNTTRILANRQLVVRRARYLDQQLLVWRATDLMKVGDVYQPVPPIVTTLLDNIPPRDTADLPSMNFYFPGMEYVFRDSPTRPPGIHKMGRVKNNIATGINIYLEDEKPVIPSQADIHHIHTPLAIIVQPHGVVIGDACGHDIPPGCIPVRRVTRTFKLHLRQPLTIANVVYHDLIIRRTTIPLGDAYALRTTSAKACHSSTIGGLRTLNHRRPESSYVRPSTCFSPALHRGPGSSSSRVFGHKETRPSVKKSLQGSTQRRRWNRTSSASTSAWIS